MTHNETHTTIKISKIFQQLFTTDKKDAILKGGRAGGKSKIAYILAGVRAAMKPDEDIVIARASYGSIKDSSYNEMCEVLDSITAFDNLFSYKTSPCRISRVDGGTIVYFLGVGGNKERTKGFKPLHKVGVVILEEAQELKSKEHLDQTMASLRRRFGEDCLVITIFNPPAQELHWINLWARSKQLDPDYLVIHSSWLDISPFLNDRDIKEILKIKNENKVYYDYMYMGIPSGAEGAVYPMFRKEVHLIPVNELTTRLESTRIYGCVIGADASVVRDCTCFVPIMILSNGQGLVCSPFIHDPKKDGSYGSHAIVQNFVSVWFRELINKYHLDEGKPVPILFSVDSASPDLVKACQFFFSNRAFVRPVNKGTQLQMVDTVQSSLTKNVVMILDDGNYYSTKGWEKYTNSQEWNGIHPLAFQLSMLVWDQTGTKYDPIVPNDISDAFTYGVIAWYGNTENMYWLSTLQRLRKDYYVVKRKEEN